MHACAGRLFARQQLLREKGLRRNVGIFRKKAIEVAVLGIVSCLLDVGVGTGFVVNAGGGGGVLLKRWCRRPMRFV